MLPGFCSDLLWPIPVREDRNDGKPRKPQFHWETNNRGVIFSTKGRPAALVSLESLTWSQILSAENNKGYVSN